MEADHLCPVVACWSLFVYLVADQFARWWHSEVHDLFGGSRSDLPGGGIVKFLICSVVADRSCPVVADWSVQLDRNE